MKAVSPWWKIKGEELIDSPSLAVYTDRVEQNIVNALKIQPDRNLFRPHVKTSKMPGVQKLLMKHGVRKFKCSTVAEAEMLGEIRAPDVLLAYQPSGPKIQRFLKLTTTYPETEFSCLIDNVSTASIISSAFRKARSTANIYIDVNNGMNRTGAAVKNIVQLFQTIRELKGLRVRGLHIYDGHITDSSIRERIRRVRADFAEVDAIFEALNDEGRGGLAMIAGGTPSFPVHAKRKNVECSPGTFVFWDEGYGHLYPEMPYQHAALVLTRVVSVISKDLLCLDLGYKSVASEKPMPRVKFLNEPRAVPLHQSEEHLVVKIRDAHRFSAGDLWYGVPTHICPTVALYDQALLINKGELSGEWQVTARKRKISI
jgi:D-threonine aldolase